MARFWNYFFVMLWIFYLIASGIHLFSKGFLLSRRVQTEQNECIRLKLCTEEENEPHCLHKDKTNELITNVNSSSEYCLPQKGRVILLVIDALKYEFGVFDENLENPLPFQNKLPVFNRMLTEQPNRTRLMKFIADAPTTTLQRLKGITTGSLPTFIDIGSNFATPEINEDNIIDQIKRNNLSAVFMGDSTWTELFPNRFVRSYPFPSFNIFDLDTVDRGINRNLPNELSQQDWSLLVAHYLGVDHCGHKYGPVHSEMDRKLTEMNAVIEKVIEQMDNETTLFVIGDHGMTTTGDHGGATDDEVTALLFAYNKKYDYLSDTKNDTMDQIDLVPTLAAILGVPIPFSNLGSTNFDIVPDVAIDHLTKSHIQMLHSWQNSKQMRYFFSNYTSDNKDTFTDQMLEDFFIKFYIFSMRVTSLYTTGALDNFNKDVKLYLQDVADKCRFVWAKFDANQMSEGLLFTAIINVFLFLLTTNLKFNEFEIIFTRDTLLFIYGSNLCVAIIAYFFYAKLGIETSEHSVLTATCVYSIAVITFLLVQNWDFIALNWSQQQHFSNLFTRIVFVFSVIVFYSNSFIVEEQTILCYLICGAIVLLLYKVYREYVRLNTWRKAKPENILQSPLCKLVLTGVFGIFLLRISYLFHRCREEQGNCTDFQNENSQFEHQNSKAFHYAHAKILDLMPILLLAIFATVMRQFLRKCGNLSGFSAHVLLARYGPIVAAIACGGHFFMSFQKLGKSSGIQQIRIDALAWIVYTIFILEILVLLVQPLMVFILEQRSKSFSRISFENIVPEIVMKMKQMYNEVGNANNDDDDIPIVYGLATVYSSILWSLCSVFVFVLAILLGPTAANGIFVILYIVGVILVLNSVLRYQRCPRLEFCVQPEFLSITLWYLLAHYSFYATSHQPTLSQINWHAAFVGRTAMYDHNNIISALLVLINTFGGPFLIFCLYPLLVIIPTALFVLYPSLLPRRTTKVVIQNQNGTKQWNIVKKVVDTTDHDSVRAPMDKEPDLDKDELNISRGELTLFENEDVFIGSLFKTGCQLVILQGIRIFSSMLACTIHCRHLMVWKIFAPRFIYEGIATYIMFGAILIGYLIVARIHAAVNRLVVKITEAA